MDLRYKVNLFMVTAVLLTIFTTKSVIGKASFSRIDFNRDWFFVKNRAEWAVDFNTEEAVMKPVILPHTWNANDMGPGLLNAYIGSGWYSKRFFPPQLMKGQRLLLEFEGVNNCHKVWVNGGYAGGRNGGFLANLCDITDFLIEGENTVLVRADNSFNPDDGMPDWIGWNRFGGITRPVWMLVREHAYLACAGVEIRTPQVSHDSTATVVKTHLEETKSGGSAITVRHTLVTPGGKILSVTSVQLATRYSLSNTIETRLPAVTHPELWSDTSPKLYLLKTEILEGDKLLDLEETRIGYRFFHFDPERGFIFNGTPTKLRGVNIHTFFPGLGNALPERFYREDIKLMKQMGCNFMRTSHYPRPKAVLDACDELGILVMEEQPFWHGSVRSAEGEDGIDNASRLVRDMVRQHGNHPSIIIWNTVNEVMIAPPFKPGVGYLPAGYPGFESWKNNPGEFPYLRRHLQKMVETFKEVDPDRPVSMVIGGQWQKNDLAGLTEMADIVACNGGAMNFSKEGFKDTQTGKHYDFTPDYFHGIHPNRIYMMSEGVLNDYFFARGDWEREEEGWKMSAKYWSVINNRPWFSGGSMWCFTDYSYYSPKVINSFIDADQTKSNESSILDNHGVVDMYRLPKELFHFYEAMWADHPVLHILGHWNHQKGSSREVVVFSNCRDVELFLNGKPLGKGISCADQFPGIENAPLVWRDVIFKEGKLEAKGKFGSIEMVDTRVTSGNPAGILLSASNDLIADGRDISYIDLKVVDSKGTRCYASNDTLRLSVDGAANIAGPETVTVTAGLARFAIRSNGIKGEVKLAVNGPVMKSCELKLTAQ